MSAPKEVLERLLESFAKALLEEEGAQHVFNYLLTLKEDLLPLALGELSSWLAVESDALNLRDVFTEGRVFWSPEGPESEGKRGGEMARSMEEGAEREFASSTAFVAAHDRAVLLGDPGSGKSTYVSMLALCHAGNYLMDPDLNLDLLPDWRASNKGELLPLHITLREIAGSEQSIWADFLESLPGQRREAQGRAIEEILLQHGGLCVLDGLDEVPEADDCREKLLSRVDQFRRSFPQVHLVVTSRTYAYKRDGWTLDHFEDTRLRPFGAEERASFLKRWYASAAPKKGLGRQEAEERRDKLTQQIEEWDHLRKLGENPLLLTLIGLQELHFGDVPRNRERLYERSVELLLEIWQLPRMRTAQGERVERLEQYLRVTRDELQKQLESLALEFHREQGHTAGLANIPRDRLLDVLSDLADRRPGRGKPSVDRLKSYVEDRAGLLSDQGSKVYSFAHRTFQEYLAARALADQGPTKLVGQVREEPRTQWREVYLLAGAKMMRGFEEAVWQLLRQTVPRVPEGGTVDAVDARMVALALRLLAESGLKASPKVEDQTELVARMNAWMQRLVDDEALPLREELLPALRDLGEIGDDRPGVGLRAGVPEIEWVPIAEGEFVYQGKRSEGAAFEMARYPVTVAQYAAFVSGGGYEDERWWYEESGEGAWGGRAWLRENQGGPEAYGEPFENPNHPQVGISWYEAQAYCKWLSTQLKREVRLPHEREWERAAAGGGSEAREFPWGMEGSEEEVVVRANLWEGKIGATSPVGLFARGRADEGGGRIDDLVGNVWEWCVNKYGESDEGLAVRGGSWNYARGHARSAIRYWILAGVRDYDLGFRLVSSPILSKG